MMNGRQRSPCGMRSHESVSTTMKKIAKVAVGKSTATRQQRVRIAAAIAAARAPPWMAANHSHPVHENEVSVARRDALERVVEAVVALPDGRRSHDRGPHDAPCRTGRSDDARDGTPEGRHD